MTKKKKAYITPLAKQNGLIKYDKYLRLINLTNDFMMSQQQFVELCVLMGYGTANVIKTDILAEMVRLELIKYCYIGATQAKMILFTKISIRHIKGKDSSDKVASLRDFKSDTPKLLAIMKVKYIIDEVIPFVKKRENEITADSIKRFLNNAHSSLLIEFKDYPKYYERLKKVADEDSKITLQSFQLYTWYTSARQKMLLGRSLTEKEQTALDFHKSYFEMRRGVKHPAYKKLALIKENAQSKVEEQKETHKKKDKQLYENISEYERLATDPRLIHQFKKQNIYVQSIKDDVITVLLFNVKKSLTEREFKAYMNSLYETFRLIYNRPFLIKFKVLCLNEGGTSTFLRMIDRAELTDLNSHIDSFQIIYHDLKISDKYLS